MPARCSVASSAAITVWRAPPFRPVRCRRRASERTIAWLELVTPAERIGKRARPPSPAGRRNDRPTASPGWSVRRSANPEVAQLEAAEHGHHRLCQLDVLGGGRRTARRSKTRCSGGGWGTARHGEEIRPIAVDPHRGRPSTNDWTTSAAKNGFSPLAGEHQRVGEGLGRAPPRATAAGRGLRVCRGGRVVRGRRRRRGRRRPSARTAARPRPRTPSALGRGGDHGEHRHVGRGERAAASSARSSGSATWRSSSTSTIGRSSASRREQADGTGGGEEITARGGVEHRRRSGHPRAVDRGTELGRPRRGLLGGPTRQGSGTGHTGCRGRDRQPPSRPR